MYYKNHDYIARAETRNGVVRYFVRFRGQVDSPEEEVDLEMFTLYTTEFAKPLEKQRKEWRRYRSRRSLDEVLSTGRRTGSFAHDLEEAELWEDIEAVLASCTEKQKRRFRLFVKGYSLTEISKIECCDEKSVRQSISPVIERMKKIFSVYPKSA